MLVLMQGEPINNILAANLKHFMGRRKLNQSALAKASGVAQTTVSLYLDPSRRQPGATGKTPSAKLSEVAMLADALSVDAWQLLRPFTDAERQAYEQIESAFQALIASARAAAAPPSAAEPPVEEPRRVANGR